MTHPSPLPHLMVVEARHLHSLAHQLLMDRELITKAVEAHQAETAGLSRSSRLMVPVDGESGLTSAANTVSVEMERQRTQLSFLGEEFTANLQQLVLDQERLLIHHTRRLTAELVERRKRFWQLLVATVEEEARKKIMAKEKEIEAMKKLNWALEEKVRSLGVENQIWRELAQTNEATANLLRENLEQVLAAQTCCIKVVDERYADLPDVAGDAESCCCGDNASPENVPLRVCRSCGRRETTVLLLPCRHLCICSFCSSAISSCPICNCKTNGSVNVNFS